MTTLLRHLFLAMLVLLFAFGCQERDQDQLDVLTFADVAGQSYEGSSQGLTWEVPDGEYYECREAYPTWKFSQGQVIQAVSCDLCLTYIATGFCQEIYYEYPLFTVTYQDMEVDEGAELLVFYYGNGQSAEFDAPDKGRVYPDAILIRISDQDLDDTTMGYDVPELDAVPSDVYQWARDYFVTNPPQGEPDEYDANL